MGRVAVIGRTLSSIAPRMWAMLRSPEMKGTLSHLPQRAPLESGRQRHHRCQLVWQAGGLRNGDCLHRTAAWSCSTLQDMTWHYRYLDFDTKSMQRQDAKPNHGVFSNSIFCRHQHAIHASIKPAHPTPPTNGPPTFSRRFRVRWWWLLGRRMNAGSKMTGALAWQVF